MSARVTSRVRLHTGAIAFIRWIISSNCRMNSKRQLGVDAVPSRSLATQRSRPTVAFLFHPPGPRPRLQVARPIEDGSTELVSGRTLASLAVAVVGAVSWHCLGLSLRKRVPKETMVNTWYISV